MGKLYTEEDKNKYCKGFKNCTLPIREYAEKMDIEPNDLKEWLKDYKEPAPFGKINLTELTRSNATKTSIKFETDTINIEIKENVDKELLKKIVDLLAVMCIA